MEFEIKNNISLKKYNTFGVEAFAKYFIEIVEEGQIYSVYEQGVFESPFFVLGGGSNILFTKDIERTIIHIGIKGINHFIEGSNIYITAAAGEIWNDLVWYCIDRGFPGMENMALIPGTVGASPIQNIGAYGKELMDIFHSCRAFDTHSGKMVTFQHKDCGFTYRDSIFKSTYKNRFIITSVTYKLSLHSEINTSYGTIKAELEKRNITSPSISDIAQIVSHIRVEKLPDPSMVGNAGSFFKNPIIDEKEFIKLQRLFPEVVYYTISDQRYKVAAGWLIEDCGWKGRVVKNSGVWKNQALVLINTGKATGNEIFELSEEIVEDVYQKFGVKLEREVNIL